MKRIVVQDVISKDKCKELIHLQLSHSVKGYIPYHSVCTINELDCSPYIVPLIEVREILLGLVEELFNEEFNLFVEWSGLVGLHKSSQIAMHADNNRDYLRQRHFSAILYLNDAGVDFDGGLFHFVDGETLDTVSPQAGSLVLFTSGDENMHKVDPITTGDRFTLTMWFTRDMEHSEDRKYLFPPNPEKPPNASSDTEDIYKGDGDTVITEWDLLDVKMNYFQYRTINNPTFDDESLMVNYLAFCQWKNIDPNVDNSVQEWNLYFESLKGTYESNVRHWLKSTSFELL